MFHAVFDKQNGWRIKFDKIDICGAASKAVAVETARLMQMSRRDHYRKSVDCGGG